MKNKSPAGYRVSFFFSSRRRHTRLQGDWSSDVCSSDLCSHAANNQNRKRPLLWFGDHPPKVQWTLTILIVGCMTAFIWSTREHAVRPLQKIGRASCRERV